jgi:ectoine hydroxylase-related dioxygenase (phytanoyl-CoA dioxygenase family)
MSTVQVIEISSGNDAQPFHRDLENNHPFVAMGPAGPEVSLNFLIALSDFTEEIGARWVIPSSNHWSDFNNRGTPEMTIPAKMSAGDALLISGKVFHGGGANRTVDMKRRDLAFTCSPSYLTPEGAYPLLIKIDMVKQMSPRTQKVIGFRSQYPKGSPGLWQSDYKDIGDYLRL